MQTRFWPLSGLIFTALAWLSPAHAAVPGGGVDAAQSTHPVVSGVDYGSEPDVALMSETGAPHQLDADLPPEQVSDDDPSALTDFRRELGPYGRWVTTPEYGTVWVPHSQAVGPNFKPYVSRGRWSLTAGNQWLWNSDYPFGSVVFHYGRWVWAPSLGWSWVPGRRYAHAWVAFRVSSDPFIGWGPLPPAFIWRNGRAIRMRRPPIPYVFAPRNRVFNRSLLSHIVWQPRRVRSLMRRSSYFRPTRAVRRSGVRAARGYVAVRRGPQPGNIGLRVTRSRVQRPSARALGMRRFQTTRNASLRRSRTAATRAPVAGTARSSRARTQARVNRNLRRSARANTEHSRRASVKRREATRSTNTGSAQQPRRTRSSGAKNQTAPKRSSGKTSTSRASKTSSKASSSTRTTKDRRTTTTRRQSASPRSNRTQSSRRATTSRRSGGATSSRSYRRSSSSRQRSRR